MLFERTAYDKQLRAALERGSKRMTKEMLTSLLAVATECWKPIGYDVEQTALRIRYEGRAAAIYAAARAKRYPSSGRQMPDVAFNWVGLVAQVDAAVYDYEPERYLVGDDDERIDDKDPAAKAFANLVRDAELSVRLPELERRAMAARTMAVNVTFKGAFDEDNPRAGKPAVELYWPSDVWIVPHHTRPDDLSTAVALIARRAGPSGLAPLATTDATEMTTVVEGAAPIADTTWFVVWTRPCFEHPDGSIKGFGKWSCEYVNLKGESYIPFGSADAESPLSRLPWALYRVGIPQGCPFVDEDRDFPLVGDDLNTNWSNLLHVADMQGHDQPYTSGHMAAEVVVGPDLPLKLGPGETAGLLSPNPKLAEMLDINRAAMRTLAITRRQSPDAYATERGPPLTGVSRKIANEPQDKARRERSHVAVAFEQNELLPILMEVAGYWGTYEGLVDDGGERNKLLFRPRMTPKDPPDFEDPEAKQRRSIEARDARMIDAARAAVEAGWYRTEDEARAALDKIEDENPKPPPPAAFGARLQQELDAEADDFEMGDTASMRAKAAPGPDAEA